MPKLKYIGVYIKGAIAQCRALWRGIALPTETERQKLELYPHFFVFCPCATAIICLGCSGCLRVSCLSLWDPGDHLTWTPNFWLGWRASCVAKTPRLLFSTSAVAILPAKYFLLFTNIPVIFYFYHTYYYHAHHPLTPPPLPFDCY